MSRTLHANCGDDKDCGCQHEQHNNRHSFRMKLATSEITHRMFQGRDHIVVPVVMIKKDVVMNGNLIPPDEIQPISWNGVPVTIGHPEVDEGFTSANSPEIIEQWAVGSIFNSRWENDMLKAEAWVDVERLNNLRPELMTMLEAGDQIDVSTGYFSDDEPKKGKSNGRSYERINRNLNPDHLALLPDETGACSWTDGCGIRANQKEATTMTSKVQGALDVIKAALLAKPGKKNARGDDLDARQIVADLISNPASPFVPDDMEALNLLSPDTLGAMRTDYLALADEEEAEGDDAANDIDLAEEEIEEVIVPEVNEGGPDVADKKEAKANAAGLPQSKAELDSLITNAVTAAVTEALKTNSLSDTDRAALATAAKINEDHRNTLIATITTNSKMTKEQVEAMPAAQLEIIANGLLPVADYSGRGLPINANASEKDDVAVKAMKGQSLGDAIRERAANKAGVH